MMTLARKQILDEYKLLIQKQIQKPKQKNQYTKDSKFTEDFKLLKQNQIYKELIIVQEGIPAFILNNNVFRLHSNVQFPRNANNGYQLGNLNIDFYSYNYKIIRVDRKGSITSVTFEPIDRPFMPVEIVKDVMGQGGPRLLESFNKLNEKKLNKDQYQILDQKALLDFEKNLTKPFVGYVSRVEKDKIVTQHRMMNDLYLACIGLDDQMLIHYIKETGLLPIPLYFAENDYNTQHLSNFFLLNTNNSSVNEMLATNYRGEKFPVQVTFQNYYYFDKEEQCYFEYLFFIWDCDKRWLSKQKLLENHRDYFNLKGFPSTLTLPSCQDIGEESRCGYKKILNQQT